MGKHVVSTRIRYVRSIKGYPFNPAMNEIHYHELERKVQEALTLLKDELKGTYYTLRALDKQIRQQLLDDHFPSKEGNRFLEVTYATRFWPTERGDNLAAVYERLVKAVQEIGKKLEFQWHLKLGFLTSCLTNLGTTIQASVHVHPPKLSADYRRRKDRDYARSADSRGEHVENEVGIYDISNRRRLGLMEREALYEMRNGVAELIKPKKQLERRIL